MYSSLFMIGTQLSGNTLITRMLSAHPKLFIHNEMGDWGVFDKPYSSTELYERIAEKLRWGW